MANGNFAGGDGTPENPYLIEDAFDLDAVRNNLAANYKLISDIDLDSPPFNEGEGWTPIGTISSRFRGSFDGDGHIIHDLFINRESENHQGLFGATLNSIIENLGVANIDVNGYSTVGGLVGYLDKSIISKSFSKGYVSGRENVGGLIGCSVYESEITNSYASVEVRGVRYYVGGAIGRVRHSNYLISNIYSNGLVHDTGVSNIGGLIGSLDVYIMENSFWDIETSGRTDSRGTRLTTEEMQTAQTFIDAGWHNETLEDGTPVWILEDGNYPRLWFQVSKYYSSEGQWESPIIDLGSGWYQTKLINIISSSPGNTNLLFEIATSSDGNVFSEYQALDIQAPPQARYVKLRASLSADSQSGNDKTLIFDQSDIENMLNLTDFVEADGQLKLKTYQEQIQEEYVELGNGRVFEHPINLSDWKSVKKIEVR